MNSSQPTLRILLIEDRKHDFLIVQRALKRSDFPSVLVWEQQGETALERLRSESFDVVLLDHKLPGMSGLSFFEAMREMGLEVPTIFVTGGGNEATAVTALKLGAQDYIVKDSRGDYLELLPVMILKAYQQWENAKARLEAESALLLRARELEALVEVSWAVRAAATIDEMLPLVLQKAVKVAKGSAAAVYMVQNEEGDLVGLGCYPPENAFIGTINPAHAGVIGQVAQSGKIHISNNLLTTMGNLSFTPKNGYSSHDDINNTITIPLLVHHVVIGVMQVTLPILTPETGRLLITLADIAGNAFHRALVMETLELRVQQRTQELTEANQRLRELSDLQTKFISDVSHELRTPITNLKLYLDLLSRGHPDKWPGYIKTLQNETARLTQLVESVLTMSRLDKARGNITFQAINLAILAQQVTESKQAEAQGNKLTLRFTAVPNLPLISGNPELLRVVLTNLLNNAIMYTPAGEIHLSLTPSPQNEAIVLKVTDTGIGILPDDLDHLFKRFYRGHNVSQSTLSGIGLGLSYAKEVVEMHHGQITIEGQPKNGTVVTITLPSAKSPATKLIVPGH